MKIGDGFKVNSVTLYAGFAQVNGVFVRTGEAVVNSALSFNVSLDEGRQLTPETVYEFTLVPRTPDTVPDAGPATVAKTVTNKK